MNYSYLSDIQGPTTVKSPIVENNRRKKLSLKKTIFLSHSHQDADIVNDVIAFLLSMGQTVYVDWLDPTMPKVTSGETAERIKNRILQCERFMVLLTERSKESKWVPWELGFADGKKPIENIAILPIKRLSATNDSTFKGLEYMELYPIISMGNVGARKEAAIFPPDRIKLNSRDKGIWLNEGWLGKDKVNF